MCGRGGRGPRCRPGRLGGNTWARGQRGCRGKALTPLARRRGAGARAAAVCVARLCRRPAPRRPASHRRAVCCRAVSPARAPGWAPAAQYLDARVAQHLQGGPHVRLQPVLHARHAQQLHLPLQALHHRGHLQSPVVHAQLGLSVAALRRDTRLCMRVHVPRVRAALARVCRRDGHAARSHTHCTREALSLQRRVGLTPHCHPHARGGRTCSRGCPPRGGGRGWGWLLTSKSWYCSSVRALFATTSVRSPSRAMFPHWKGGAGHTRPRPQHRSVGRPVPAPPPADPCLRTQA